MSSSGPASTGWPSRCWTCWSTQSPGNSDGRLLLADAFEQLGYQHESPSVRNSYLAAALELRSGIPEGVAPSSTGPDIIRALSTASSWTSWASAWTPSGPRAAAHAEPGDPGRAKPFVVELSNGTLTNLSGFLADDADLTLTINRSDLESAMTGQVPLVRQVAEGRATVEGDPAIPGGTGRPARALRGGFRDHAGNG